MVCFRDRKGNLCYDNEKDYNNFLANEKRQDSLRESKRIHRPENGDSVDSDMDRERCF